MARKNKRLLRPKPEKKLKLLSVANSKKNKPVKPVKNRRKKRNKNLLLRKSKKNLTSHRKLSTK